MARSQPKLTLHASRDIAFDRLDLSQDNVRRVKAGVSLEALADDIARRGLLQSLNVRPRLDDDGKETGRFEVPAGGRRYRALEILVKRKAMAKTALVPCIVKPANDAILAEEDSLAENGFREPLHPLDEFRGMQRLVEKGQTIEAIAAHFGVTATVVRQRLRLAGVSPGLHAVYAEDGLTLDQLMAFSVSEDHARQEQVFAMLAHSFNTSPAYIRARLTEDTVRANDRRARFVGVDAYVDAGGCVLRDLFEDDRGGWLQDPALLDRLVLEKLRDEGVRIADEGWKWVTVAIDFPYGHVDGLREIQGRKTEPAPEDQARIDALKAEADALETEWSQSEEIPEEVNERVEAIDAELGILIDRPIIYDATDIAMAGVFVSLDTDGTLYIERGWVRPEDELAEGTEADPDTSEAEPEGDSPATDGEVRRAVTEIGGAAMATDEEEEGQVIKPLPDRLVSELTAHRTIALQDALAQNPSVAFLAVLHALVLTSFHLGSRETCLQLSLNRVTFDFQAPGMKVSPSAQAILERHAAWKSRFSQSDTDLWEALQLLDGGEQAALFAHCAAFGLNAQWEAVPRYDNGRVSAHGIARRLAHSHVLARAVGLDMVGAGWKPTVDNYLGRVAKPRILEAVTEAKGTQTAGLIDHLKKGDMAREAERLLEDAGWLPEPLRTPAAEKSMPDPEDGTVLPAFLDGADDAPGPDPEASDYAIAAE